ncbi:hypothetical protein MDL80_04195 [Streptococcus suis]|uniref:hypothetical protein n=1 Tax=Streptococcus suis TaxID=1307 RepID=UPI0004211696|nr:hypothetical protein [Streptococcus suis]MBS8077545.1 hypothetical protein [Streptococcus suis]MCG9868249.1 hypothetical protein [Streptococcus suis]MCG9870423.1 hypothetical protein [Streptococcus suis]MCG9871140.1 hypothetical protein [Streptococcus suis]MCG9897488.1 hypothetical protein [Streptococcus suis]
MTRTLQEIKAELEALHQENQTAIEKYTEDLKAIDPKIEQAKQDIADAQTTVDAEAYDIAKRELWTAENTKEMLKNKLDELTQKPLISKRDYNKLVDEINVLAEKENMTIINKVSEMFPEFEKLKKLHTENYQLANDTLEILENKIGKNEESYKYSDQGHLLPGRYSGLEYTPKRSVVYLLDSLVEHYERMVK